MNKIEFNTQIATTIEQSKRLLELGLDPNTADMHMTNASIKGPNYTDEWSTSVVSYKEMMFVLMNAKINLEDNVWDVLPSWSLHRIVSMLPSFFCHNMRHFYIRLYKCKLCYNTARGSKKNIEFFKKDNLYDNIIDCIEWLIQNNYFNKEYLK